MVGAPPTSPTWFAEVGPAPRGWIRKRPGSVRQLPAPRQPVAEGSVRRVTASPGALQGSTPAPLGARGRVRPPWPPYPGVRAPADVARWSGRRRAEPLGPARRLLLGAALRGGGVRRDHRRDDPLAAPGCRGWPSASASARPDVVDARVGIVRLGGPQRSRGAVLRPAGGGRAGPAAPAGLAAVGGGGLGRDGGAAQRLAVQRHALGPARLRGRRHARGAGTARTSAPPASACCSRWSGALAGCASSWATSAGWWPEPSLAATAALLLAPALQPWESSPDGSVTGRRRSRATCRATAPTCWPTTARSPTTTSRPRVDLAADVEAGERPRPDFVLWPENSTAIDPFARPADPDRHRDCGRGDRRTDPGRRHGRRRPGRT